MQNAGTPLGDLAVNALFLLAATTVFMLLIRRFVPYLGDRLWRVYCDMLIWLLRVPFRVVRFLIKAVITHHRL